jgi:hypothetical protein
MLIIKKGFHITMTHEYSFLNAISKVTIKGTGSRDYNSVFMVWFDRSCVDNHACILLNSKNTL